MTSSFKFHFRSSSKGTKSEGKLFIRVIRNRRYKNLSTGYSVFPDEWDSVSSRIILPGADSPRFGYLKTIDISIREDLSKLKMIISLLDKQGEYAVEDVVSGFKGSPGSDDLLSYSERVGLQLYAQGRRRTARAYRSAVKSLTAFNGGKPLKMSDICVSLMNTYEKNLIDRGLQLNTVSFYMRNLRAIYNRAIAEGIVIPGREKPFEKVYTGVFSTIKRALNKAEINTFAQLDVTLTEALHSHKKRLEEMQRQSAPANLIASTKRAYVQTTRLRESLMYFMFCFHARGMSYVDLAYLRKSEIRENKITYIRKKSGQQLQVKITTPMRRIINYFFKKNSGSAYVFPIVDPRRGDERCQYETGLRMQNNRLHTLSRMAGLKKNVTTHVSRHSWATIAKYEMVNISMISEALGHTNIKTTIIYLDSFERSRMDLLSDKISGVVKKRIA